MNFLPSMRLIVLLPGFLTEIALAQNVEFRQISSPPGVVNQTTYPVLGAAVTTVTAPATSSNYSFTHWTVAGLRMNDGTGSGINPAAFVINDATEAVANYTLTAQDSDSDGLPDWYEIQYFANLTQLPIDDFDGDGFTNAQEILYNQHPGAFDERMQGGTSRRRGLVFNVAPGVGDPSFIYSGTSRRRSDSFLIIQNPSLVQLVENSNPVGILSQTRVLSVGQTVNLTIAPSSTGGYRYTGWLVDGVRFDRPPQNQPIPITLTHNTQAVARYILETADTDADGIPDWIEWYNFNSLQYNLMSDPEGDGMNWAEETFRGYSLVVHDQLDQGGVSRRRSVLFDVDAQGRFIYKLASDPATILDQTQRVLPGTLLTVPDRTNHTYANYKFAWWDLNGTRRTDASGASLNQFSFVINASSTATAHYVDPTVDTDNDGILDWHERYYYGTLGQSGTDDTDGDGFTYAQELYYGQSPRVADTRQQGGVSRRRGVTMAVNAILLDMPPALGENAATHITSTTAQLSAVINPIGSPTTVTFEFRAPTGQWQQSPSQNIGSGLLALTAIADLSGLTPDTQYEFRVVAVNGRGSSTSDTTTFHTKPPTYIDWATAFGVGDPTADADLDGLLNLQEWAFNLDPTTPSTTPTAARSNGSVIEFTYARSVAAFTAGTAFIVEWSDTLPNSLPWSNAGVTETVLSDDGTVQQVKATVPTGGGPRRFIRLRIAGQ